MLPELLIQHQTTRLGSLVGLKQKWKSEIFSDESRYYFRPQIGLE